MRALLVVAVALLVSGCSIVVDKESSSAPSTSPSATSPTADPSSSPSDDAPLTVPAEDPPPCQLVRAGIDAFNAGDPEETVKLFEEALPLAKEYAKDEPGRTSNLLLQAVQYYAGLPADQYAGAITSSPEFKRHQVVTLGVCRYGGLPGASPSDDAQTT